jgi:hypothetical protein
MKDQTPWERCIITGFLRSVLTEDDTDGPRPRYEPHWTDWGGPLLMFLFLLSIVAFVQVFPNGIWSLK